jgi:hypothetical protein
MFRRCGLLARGLKRRLDLKNDPRGSHTITTRGGVSSLHDMGAGIPPVRHLVITGLRHSLYLVPLAAVPVMFLMHGMGVIIEINRDFPFRLPLSFDEAAMDVLDWLEECARSPLL